MEAFDQIDKEALKRAKAIMDDPKHKKPRRMLACVLGGKKYAGGQGTLPGTKTMYIVGEAGNLINPDRQRKKAEKRFHHGKRFGS